MFTPVKILSFEIRRQPVRIIETKRSALLFTAMPQNQRMTSSFQCPCAEKGQVSLSPHGTKSLVPNPNPPPQGAGYLNPQARSSDTNKFVSLSLCLRQNKMAKKNLTFIHEWTRLNISGYLQNPNNVTIMS